MVPPPTLYLYPQRRMVVGFAFVHVPICVLLKFTLCMKVMHQKWQGYLSLSPISFCHSACINIAALIRTRLLANTFKCLCWQFNFVMWLFSNTFLLHGHWKPVLSVEDGRSGTFQIGNERFPAALLDLPCVVESYKTYDDNVLIKTADIGQVRSCNSCSCTAQEIVDWLWDMNRWLWSEKK